jgi:hypothetical protein
MSTSAPSLPRHLQPLLANCPARVAYAIALLAGIAFVWRLFPAAFLAGHGEMFDIGDAAQHVSGWWFYARDSWHLPVLHTRRLAYPDGVSIAFTDSIPLAALLFKPFATWLPAHFHYIGWWHAVAFVAQALAAVFVIRSVGVRHAWGALVAAVFALTWPALLFRLGHTSLLTHAIVLVALGLYVRGHYGEWSRARVLACFVGLHLVALMVHPYLLTMAFAVFVAWLVDDTFANAATLPVDRIGAAPGSAGRESVARRSGIAAAALVGSIAVILAAAWAVGYGGGGTTAVGYGIYSMNLAAPFCGGRFFDCVPTALAGQPLAAYHFVDATTGQYEGFNYLGLGLGILLLAALVMHARRLPALLARSPALVAILLLMALYSLSNRVFWQQTELLNVDLPSALRRVTDSFRASGRFFWPAGYALLFLGLAAVLRRRTAWAVALSAVALLLQWADTGPLRARIQHAAAAAPVDDLSPWAAVMNGVDTIRLYPPYDCDRTEPAIYLHWQRLAGYFGKTIDTGYISRPSTACRLRVDELDAPPAERTLYVTAASRVFDMPPGFVTAARRGQCTQVNKVVACGPAVAGSPPVAGSTPVQALPLSDRLNWSARDLPTLIGVLRDDALVPRDPATQGVLSYGPYAAVPTELPPTPIRIALDYASQAPTGQVVGRWDIALGAAVLASGEFTGTGGTRRTLSVPVSLANQPAGRLEVRTIYTATGDLRLHGIAAGRDLDR